MSKQNGVTMRIKKFQGRNMRESLEKMRLELGEEAVILSSRELSDGAGIPVIEVVAGIEPEDLAAHREQRAKVPASITHAAGEQRKAVFPTVQKMPDSDLIRKAQFVRGSSAETPASNSSLQEEIERLKDSVNAMLHIQRYRYSPSLPTPYRRLYQELRSCGFDDEQAMVYVGQLSSNGFVSDYNELRTQCRELLSQSVKCVQPIRLGGSRKVIVLVGPPGSGKSCVIARLSTSFALTVDAQSTVLSDSVVPQSVRSQHDSVNTIDNLPAAQWAEQLEAHDEDDFVFVELHCDARDPLASLYIQESCRVLDAHAVLLCIPAGLQERSIERWTEMCKDIPQTSLVITNLDSQTLYGDFFRILKEQELSVAFVSDGSIQPQSIRAAQAEMLVKTLLPDDQNATKSQSGTIIEKP